jgi:hypothetical protein
MESRPNTIGPPLAKGMFKPDLLALCAKYDSNVKAYKVLVQRKKNAGVYLDQLAATAKAYMEETSSIAAETEASDKANLASAKETGGRLKTFQQRDDPDDIPQVTAALAEYAGKVKTFVSSNHANRTKQLKLDTQYETNVKKISDNYAKETKDIKTQIDTVTKDSDTLEAKIRKLLVPYQAAAKSSPLLHDAIGRITTALA